MWGKCNTQRKPQGSPAIDRNCTKGAELDGLVGQFRAAERSCPAERQDAGASDVLPLATIQPITSNAGGGAEMVKVVLRSRPILSVRQHEILQLIVKGHTNKEIAEVLQITEGTVKEHTTALFSKLGVRTRAQAAAVHTGLL
jgi:DNA-binding CsgD family transcriptional regulator